VIPLTISWKEQEPSDNSIVDPTSRRIAGTGRTREGRTLSKKVRSGADSDHEQQWSPFSDLSREDSSAQMPG
jgi:hypothetical protein